MSDNWIVSNLENALADWNGKLAEIWALLTQSPETFKGGTIWSLILSVHNALVGIGYGLLVLFFAMAILFNQNISPTKGPKICNQGDNMR